jgi:hypothetical protein
MNTSEASHAQTISERRRHIDSVRLSPDVVGKLKVALARLARSNSHSVQQFVRSMLARYPELYP